jgi:hypothetical protein
MGNAADAPSFLGPTIEGFRVTLHRPQEKLRYMTKSQDEGFKKMLRRMLNSPPNNLI